MKNIILIATLVFVLILIFVLNLHKNVVATGENPFSLKNIIIVGVFFLIVVPLKRLFHNLFRRYKGKKAERKVKN